MRGRLACVVAAVLLVAADSPTSDLGEAWQEIPPGTWELVRGWQGDRPVAEADVVLSRGQKVDISWRLRPGGLGVGLDYTYQVDPVSGVANLPPNEGSVCLVDGY